MRLTTKRLVLRDYRLSDAKAVTRHINNLNISRHLLSVSHPYTQKDAKQYILRSMKAARKKKREKHSFVITLAKEPIGAISLDKVDSFHGTATLGYWLAEPYWRQGLMTDAATAVIDFAFKKLKLRRINVTAYTTNPASAALLRKLGFRHEGTAAQAVRCQATKKIHDLQFYGLLRKDWKGRRT